MRFLIACLCAMAFVGCGEEAKPAETPSAPGVKSDVTYACKCGKEKIVAAGDPAPSC